VQQDATIQERKKERKKKEKKNTSMLRLIYRSYLSNEYRANTLYWILKDWRLGITRPQKN
jgi:hypothetical protein